MPNPPFLYSPVPGSNPATHMQSKCFPVAPRPQKCKPENLLNKTSTTTFWKFSFFFGGDGGVVVERRLSHPWCSRGRVFWKQIWILLISVVAHDWQCRGMTPRGPGAEQGGLEQAGCKHSKHFTPALSGSRQMHPSPACVGDCWNPVGKQPSYWLSKCSRLRQGSQEEHSIKARGRRHRGPGSSPGTTRPPRLSKI